MKLYSKMAIGAAVGAAVGAAAVIFYNGWKARKDETPGQSDISTLPSDEYPQKMMDSAKRELDKWVGRSNDDYAWSYDEAVEKAKAKVARGESDDRVKLAVSHSDISSIEEVERLKTVDYASSYTDIGESQDYDNPPYDPRGAISADEIDNESGKTFNIFDEDARLKESGEFVEPNPVPSEFDDDSHRILVKDDHSEARHISPDAFALEFDPNESPYKAVTKEEYDEQEMYFDTLELQGFEDEVLYDPGLEVLRTNDEMWAMWYWCWSNRGRSKYVYLFDPSEEFYYKIEYGGRRFDGVIGNVHEMIQNGEYFND